MIIVVHQVESANQCESVHILYRESPKAVAINVDESFCMKHMLNEQPKDIHC